MEVTEQEAQQSVMETVRVTRWNLMPPGRANQQILPSIHRVLIRSPAIRLSVHVHSVCHATDLALIFLRHFCSDPLILPK